MNFCVLGAGAWGTAMAVYLSKCGHSVSLIPRRVEHALTLSSDRENKDYLPGVNFDQDLQIGCSLRPVLMECEYLFLLVRHMHFEKFVSRSNCTKTILGN